MTQKKKNIEQTQVISRDSMKKIEKNKKGSNKKTKTSFNYLNIFLLIGSITIIIPILIFGWILLSAASKDGPIIGNRFENDLDPAITESQVETLKNDLVNISDVEGVEVNLISATLRINLDVTDTIQGVYIDRVANDALLDNVDKEEDEEETEDEKEKVDEEESSEEEETQVDRLSEIALEAYNKIFINLNKDTYFVNANGKKMYDIEIHVYNSLDKVDADDFAYLTLIKSSNMSNPSLQLVSDPLYSDLAESLLTDTENRLNPTAEPEIEGDINVGGPDVETNEDGNEGE